MRRRGGEGREKYELLEQHVIQSANIAGQNSSVVKIRAAFFAFGTDVDIFG